MNLGDSQPRSGTCQPHEPGEITATWASVQECLSDCVALWWNCDVVTAVRGLDARAGGSASRLARRSRCERGNHWGRAARSRSTEVRWESASLWRARSARSFARWQQKDASIRYSPAPSTTRTSAAACPCTGQELARIVV